MKSYPEKIEAIVNTMERSLQDLGVKYRKEVIIPLCKKYKLDFFSGNGEFFFVPLYGTDVGTSLYSWDDELLGAHPHLVPVFQILKIDIDYINYFGNYIETWQYPNRPKKKK
jgi:hypothetical protein